MEIFLSGSKRLVFLEQPRISFIVDMVELRAEKIGNLGCCDLSLLSIMPLISGCIILIVRQVDCSSVKLT